MVEKAKAKGCYDLLEVAELVAFLDSSLKSLGSEGQPYDLLVAADVFVVGQISHLILWWILIFCPSD